MKIKNAVFLISFSMVACSSPATSFEIKEAIKKCPNVAADIRFQTRSHGFYHEASVVTKRALKSYLKDCLAEKKEKEDPNSKENILERQRAIVSEN